MKMKKVIVVLVLLLFKALYVFALAPDPDLKYEHSTGNRIKREFLNYNKASKDENKNFILTIVTEGSKKILHISFNNNEGTDGTLKLYNESHMLIKESNFELIKYPYYASVDISEFLPGEYIAELTTREGVHISILKVE